MSEHFFGVVGSVVSEALPGEAEGQVKEPPKKAQRMASWGALSFPLFSLGK
jgi:hypothetical protein